MKSSAVPRRSAVLVADCPTAVTVCPVDERDKSPSVIFFMAHLTRLPPPDCRADRVCKTRIPAGQRLLEPPRIAPRLKIAATSAQRLPSLLVYLVKVSPPCSADLLPAFAAHEVFGIDGITVDRAHDVLV
jgi:hypothetical protein